MILCPLTCGNVAYICQCCQHLQMIGILWLTRQGRPVVHCAPVPAALPAPCPGSPPMSYGTSNPVRYFGQQVRRARRAAGWTLAEFGQRIGYDPGQISRIENGKRPPTELFAQMCDRAFPDRDGWFGEFYAESRTWIATPPWFRSWVEHEQHAATLRICLETLLFQPVSQRDVLRVAKLRTCDFLALQFSGRIDLGLHHKEGTTRGCSGDDADCLAVGLSEGVYRWIRSDVRGIESAGQDCRHYIGTRIEGLGVELVGSELLGEAPALLG